MLCKDLESVLASEGLGPLPADAAEHLVGCVDCQGFLADLQSIVAVAKTIPAEVDPPDRVWISLRAQLEAEGIIMEPAEVPAASSWWENLAFVWKPRSLAAAGAGLVLVATTIFLTHMPQGPSKIAVNNQPVAPAPVANVSVSPQPAASAVNPPASAVSAPASVTATAKNNAPAPAPARPRVKELGPSPSELASTTLTQAELNFPSNMQLAGNSQVDASLRQNLRTLNEFIAECEQHLRQNPHDELAREYLNLAYQQKADLLSAMMENGRSDQ